MIKRVKCFSFCFLLGLLLAAFLLPAVVSAEDLPGENDPRIARLDVTFPCGCREWRSGTMISKIGMVTPSGSLYCTKHGKQYSSVVFYFGWKGNSKAYFIYDGPFDCHAYETFSNGYSPANDIAYIKFPVAIGDHTGWYPCKVAGDEELKKAELTVRDVKEDGVLYEFKNIGWIQSAKIASWTINDKDLYSTYGPPVFMADEETGKSVLVAIHISHNSNFEFSRRITTRVYNDMKDAGIFAENPGVPAVELKEEAPAADLAPEAPPAEKESRPAAAASASAGNEWICDSCGQKGNIGNFCFNCGSPRPAVSGDGTVGSDSPEPAEQSGEDGNTGAPEGEEITADSRIAYIESAFSCGCTSASFGTLVGPCGMVVQAEALYCPEHGKPFSSVVFNFGKGKDGSLMEYTGEFACKAYDQFENGFSAKNNIGYVVFPFAVGDMYGWYECRVVSDEGLSGSAATVRSVNEDWEVVDIPVVLTVRSEKQVSVPSREYFYTGVPLFLAEKGKDPVLVGIECASSKDGSTELFRRITRRVYDDMKKAGVFGEE